MSHKILVAFCSDFTISADFAGQIKAFLSRNPDILVDVLPYEDIKFDISYDSVILGVGIKEGSISCSGLIEFVKLNKELLDRIPVAVYSICTTMLANTEETREQITCWLAPLFQIVQPFSIAFFTSMSLLQGMPFPAQVLEFFFQSGGYTELGWDEVNDWVNIILPEMTGSKKAKPLNSWRCPLYIKGVTTIIDLSKYRSQTRFLSPNERKALLMKATKVFASNGFNCTNPGDLMDATVKNGSRIFHEFGSMPELIIDVFKFAGIAQVEEAVNLTNIGLICLRDFMQSILDGYEEDPVRAPMAMSLVASAFSNLEMRKYANNVLGGRIGYLQQYIRKGIEDGSIKPDTNIDNVAQCLMGISALLILNRAIANSADSRLVDIIHSCQRILDAISVSPGTAILVIPKRMVVTYPEKELAAREEIKILFEQPALPLPENRREMLDRAIEIFAEKGFNCTSASDLMDATGGPASRIFQEFGSIPNIMTEAFMNVDAEIIPLYEKAIAGQPNGLAALRAILLTITNSNFNMPFRSPLILNFKAAAFFHPELKKVANEYIDRRFEIYRRVLKKGIQDGSIKPDTDVENIVYRIMSCGFFFTASQAVSIEEINRESVNQAFQRLLDDIAAPSLMKDQTTDKYRADTQSG